MATKSKNIKYSKGTKTAAVLIAVIMFFSSGYFANLFIRGFADYNAYDKGRNHYTHTNAFRELMNTVENYYISDFDTDNQVFDSFEEFKKSGLYQTALADYDALVAKVSEAYDILESSGIEVYVTNDNSYRYLYPYKNFVYLFDYRGSIQHEDNFFYQGVTRVYPHDEPMQETSLRIVPSTTAVELTEKDGTSYTAAAARVTHTNSINSQVWVESDGNGRYQKNDSSPILRFYLPGNGQPPLEVQDIGEALRAINSINGYTCYGESTKTRFLEEVETTKEQFLADFYNNNTSHFSYDYILNQIKTVNYAIIGNGKIKTNCGVTATDTEAQIIEKLGGEFIEASINGTYKILKSNEYKSVPSVYDEFSQWLFGNNDSILEQSQMYFADTKNTAAYFSFALNGDVTDPFMLSHRAYNSFIGAPINNITTCLVLFAISFIIACAACIYLLSVAGKTADGIKINFFDKIPMEINWIIGAGVAALAAAGAVFVVICEAFPDEILHSDILKYGFTVTLLKFVGTFTDSFVGAFASIFFMIITGLLASLIRNIRNKSFWKNTLCWQIIRLAGWLLKIIWKFLVFIFKPFEKIFKKIGAFFKKQIDKIKYILACDYSKGQGTKFKIVSLVSTAAVLLLLLLTGMWAGKATDWGAHDFSVIFFLVLLVFAAVGLFAALIFVSLDRIMACVSQAREGKLDGKIDTKFMPPFMRRFAEDILSMQDGLQSAVESAVKDQRMKAELITNVSHDLKTPLTSIVNYVDLLKKCEVEDETAQRYINVLDEKAARMKKLIEDLVEASKASSGAIEIHPVKVNLCEFAAQAVGEHEDELKTYNIGLVLKTPPAPVTVTADSQKTSRIVENLFSNIRKYAMEGTRVYVEVADGTDYASIIFKNISKYPLDVSADELTQRFVRGDASRSGEGSGLGLSIAQNLCELQKGKFRVEVDGDLFKVTLSLPKTE
ncbi:MAG: HAMP domain-containing histidine kinase [Clostridia bacterium]|nr:HAMP domain-containing histidine kinase [Clostridia bacterium]